MSAPTTRDPITPQQLVEKLQMASAHAAGIEAIGERALDNGTSAAAAIDQMVRLARHWEQTLIDLSLHIVESAETA